MASKQRSMIQAETIKRTGSIYLTTQVCAIRNVSTHLRCISIQHEAIKKAGPVPPGAHFKLFIPKDKTRGIAAPDLSTGRPLWHNENEKPFVRTYTIRRLDREMGTLDVEFVLHGDNGPASGWAGSAAIGDYLAIGIKFGKRMPDRADWYLFAGDETALPAIAAMLEALPAKAKGIALLEIEKPADAFIINTNSAVAIRWLSREGTPPEQSELLLNTIKDIVQPDPMPNTRHVWIAGENNMVRATRKYAMEQLGLNREELHATVYWKAGLSEDALQKIRRDER
jgi:NADPH-dependent ferric siderophore reductase